MHFGLELHKAEIEKLPTSLKAALAAACTQRQGEPYRAYKKRTGSGDSKGFDNLLDAIWKDVCCQKASPQELKKWEALSEKLYLGKNAKNDMYAPNVQCALLSLQYSIDVLVTGDAQNTISAAHNAFESIHDFLTNPIGKKPQIDGKQPDMVGKVLAHPLTQAEHRRQERDLFDAQQAFLRQETLMITIDRLRKRAEIEAHSFIPIVDGPDI